MGFLKSKEKKKLLKKIFKTCFAYYKTHRDYIEKNKLEKSDNEVHLFDGSILHELCHSIVESNYKNINYGGRNVFNAIFDTICIYLNVFKYNIITFDLDNRPKIKDLDTGRYYDKHAKIYSKVNDTNFPRRKDKRIKDIENLRKEIKKHERNKNFGGVKGRMYKKISNNSDRIKKGNKTIRYHSIVNKSDLHYAIKDTIVMLEKLENEVQKNPIDSWLDGKGVCVNRKMVYRYYTQMFEKRIKTIPPRENSIFVMDGAVDDLGNWSSMKLNIGSCSYGDQYTEKKTSIVNTLIEKSLLLGEGEQTIMGYIIRLYYKNKIINNYVIHSVDADSYTYCIFFYFICTRIPKFSETPSFTPRINICSKNFYFKKYVKIGPDSNKVYYVDMMKMSQCICKMYSSKVRNPLLTFGSYIGIFFGCDFIRNVHKDLQIPNNSPKSTVKFLDFWFNRVLKGKYKTRTRIGIANDCEPRTITSMDLSVDYKEIKSENHMHGIEYRTNIDKVAIFSVFKRYYRENGSKMTKSQRIKLLSVCLNTEYVANYMLNQYRLLLPEDRIRIDPYCCTVDNDGCNIYGYIENKDGLIVQSEKLPKMYDFLIR